jgi:hypothetical protein
MPAAEMLYVIGIFIQQHLCVLCHVFCNVRPLLEHLREATIADGMGLRMPSGYNCDHCWMTCNSRSSAVHAIPFLWRLHNALADEFWHTGMRNADIPVKKENSPMAVLGLSSVISLYRGP